MKSLNKSAWIAVLVISALIYGAFFGSEQDSTQIPALAPSTSEMATPPQESLETQQQPSAEPSTQASDVAPKESVQDEGEALKALTTLPIKGRAPKTGYSRELFASDWQTSNGCDTRNQILLRDLAQINFRSGSNCIIETGVLNDPFTGQVIGFQRGIRTSLDVQIDHVVSLSDAWQKGAQQLSSGQRFAFYNDPLNLLAVWGPANSQKSDSDAASWLPSNKGFRCAFVARQIAVKDKYGLWVTQAELDAMSRVLSSCPKQGLPSK